MGVKKLWFPIALAILWVLMAAMTMVYFASFSETTNPRHAAGVVQARSTPRVARN